MKTTYHSPLTGKVKTDNQNFIGKGGQASVFRHRGYALKIYHNPAAMVPEAKLRELAQLSVADVLKPLDVLLDRKDNAVGYVMEFCRNAEPLCRLFANGFKRRHGVELSTAIDLLKDMQQSISAIHQEGFLVVDLNELNVLIKTSWDAAVFIDVDSYQTPSFPAGAIMESIRDPVVTKNRFTTLSDWYSFAVLAFQLYIGIHPFKGRHPNYKKGDWQQRMRDGASAFDAGVGLPVACNDLSVIPKPHAEWLKTILSNRDRTVPPWPDQSGPVCIGFVQPRQLQATPDYSVTEVARLSEPILDAFQQCGIFYFLTASGIWCNGRKVAVRAGSREAVLFADAGQLAAAYDGETLRFKTFDGSTAKAEPADDVFYREGVMYSVFEDTLFEHVLTSVGSRVIVSKRSLCGFVAGHARVFDGLMIQETLEHCILVIPAGEGRCCVRPVPELSGYRIVNAVSRGTAAVVLAEKDGVYHRFVLVFAADFQSYQVRAAADVEEMNLTLAGLPNGICVLPIGDGQVEVFRDAATVRTMEDAPIGADQILLATGKGLHVVNGSVLARVQVKSA